jgi:hypothetical protein
VAKPGTYHVVRYPSGWWLNQVLNSKHPVGKQGNNSKTLLVANQV